MQQQYKYESFSIVSRLALSYLRLGITNVLCNASHRMDSITRRMYDILVELSPTYIGSSIQYAVYRGFAGVAMSKLDSSDSPLEEVCLQPLHHGLISPLDDSFLHKSTAIACTMGVQ